MKSHERRLAELENRAGHGMRVIVAKPNETDEQAMRREGIAPGDKGLTIIVKSFAPEPVAVD